MKKKLFAVAAATGLLFYLAGSSPAKDKKKVHKSGEKIERSMPVDPQATVTLCVASGTLTVRGWDKHEVRVRSTDAAQLEFRRIDKPREPQMPAVRVDVMVLDKTSRMNPKLDCQAIAGVEMDVPAGATVQVQTRDGDIRIAGVAAAYAGSQNGDIIIERATKLVEAGSVGGSILLRDSSGRVNLNSAGGGVEAINVSGADIDDTFEVGTVSGDIQLDRINNPKVMAKTVNGTLTMSGALVKSGHYAFTNMTGDVLLTMPHDASFRLIAKVSEKRSIVSEFPLKYIGETPPPPAPVTVTVTPKPDEGPKRSTGPEPGPTPKPKLAPIVIVPYVLRRVEALYGTGDATISIASFGGTVRLKKL